MRLQREKLQAPRSSFLASKNTSDLHEQLRALTQRKIESAGCITSPFDHVIDVGCIRDIVNRDFRMTRSAKLPMSILPTGALSTPLKIWRRNIEPIVARNGAAAHPIPRQTCALEGRAICLWFQRAFAGEALPDSAFIHVARDRARCSA